MLKIVLTAFMLPLLLFLGSSPRNYAAQNKKISDAPTGTFQKMIVQNGSAIMDLDLNHLNGISSASGTPTMLQFVVAANSFFPILVNVATGIATMEPELKDVLRALGASRIQIVRKALQSPARQIAENAGTDGSIVVGKLTEKSDPNYGFDAQSGDYKDMVSAGIVDPAKVVRVALQDAASVAGLLITTEAMVTDRPEPKPAMMPHDDHGMGGMGGF